VTSGSPADISIIRDAETRIPKTIDATLALAKRGLTMSQAKLAIETVIEFSTVCITLPMVEDKDAVIADLAAAGFAATLSPTAEGSETQREYIQPGS
jgi:putative transcriptional regulator